MNKKLIWPGLGIFLFVVNLVLKGYYLNYRDINLDEAFTIFHAQKTLKDLITIFTTENNPPFHFLITHFMIKSFGLSVLNVRFTSLLFSSLTAIVIYRIGLQNFNFKTAVVASLIFTFSTFHVLFSHEVRVYPLFSLLTALLVLFLFTILTNPDRKINYFFLGLFNVLLIYSHYLGFVLFFAEIAVIVLFRKKFINWKYIFLMFIITIAAYLPVLIIFLTRLKSFVTEGTWVATPLLSEVYGNINRFLNDRLSTAMLIVLIITGCFILFRKKLLTSRIKETFSDTYVQVLLFIFIFCYLGMYIISILGFPVFLDRYLLFTTVPLFLLIAKLLYSFSPGKIYTIIFGSLFLITMLFNFEINPDNNRQTKAVAETVKNHKSAGTPVIISPGYFDINLLFYYNREAFRDFGNKDQYLREQLIYPVNHADQIDPKILKSKKLIFVDAAADFSFPGNNIRNRLEEIYPFSNVHTFHEDLWVYVYSKTE